MNFSSQVPVAQLASLLPTLSHAHLDTISGFFNQIIGTTPFLVCVCWPVQTTHNNPVPHGLDFGSFF